MGLIVALKKDGIVYMGSDSLVVRYGVKDYLTNPNSYRIFPVKGCHNMLMALDGRIVKHNIAKCSYLVSETTSVKDNINFDFMVNEFVLRLFDLFEERHIINAKDEEYCCSSNMIVAFKDKLFQIFQDGGVVEFDDYIVIGSGKEEALGSLLSTELIEDLKKRILLALKAGLKGKTKVAYPFVITDTNSCKFEIVIE